MFFVVASLFLVVALLSFSCYSTPFRTSSKASNEFAPPECQCCVMREAPASLSHQLRIASERTGVQRIRISGVVYESDGKKPARDVVMYFYQTDETGHYSKRGDEPRDSFAWWHGKQRGWLKTNAAGQYELETIKPAPYPDGSAPAHIHTIVLSPRQKHCYYIADFVFRGDSLLTSEFWEATDRYWDDIGLSQKSNYNGVKLNKAGGNLFSGERNITLFAEYDLPKIHSGRDITDQSPAFDPQHAWGPDKGSHACPMCKYGYQPGVLYWVNTDSDWLEVETWCRWLEEMTSQLGEQNFKAYVIYTNPENESPAQLDAKLEALGKRLDLRRIALTYVTALNDRKSYVYLNQINPQTRNTFIVYYNRRLVDKFVNLPHTEQATKLLANAIKRAQSDRQLYKLAP